MMTIEQLQYLQTPAGRDLLAEIDRAAPTPATGIAIGVSLRARWPADIVAAAMETWVLRQHARAKFGATPLPWLTRVGLEQASSTPIARYRTHRFTEFPAVIDACCGIGGDLVALAADQQREHLIAIDADPLHLAMAAANVRDLGIDVPIRFIESAVESATLPAETAMFIDPARRAASGRLTHGDSSPSLEWCIAQETAGKPVGIKFAPGIDRDRIPPEWELETIAIGFDLKEAVLWSPALAQGERTATVIGDGEVVSMREVAGDPPLFRAPEPGDILLDPNPSVTRAGLVADLARSIGAVMIDPQIAFLIAEAAVETPFARSYRIVASLPWHERMVKRTLRELEAGAVDVRRRGLAGDVNAIARRLRGTGHRPFTVAMTRVMDRPWAIVCQAPSTPSGQ